MYQIHKTKSFLKSVRKINEGVGGKKIILELGFLIDKLASEQKLDANYKDHPLKGEYEGTRECHIRGDVLLIYKIEKEKMILVLIEIGSHSYLF